MTFMRSLGFGLSLLVAVSSCESKDEDPQPRSFALNFQAMAKGLPVTCATPITGLGADGSVSVGLSDLRFYISDLKFWDAQGVEVPVSLDINEFQYEDPAGKVALIDLTSNVEGTCTQNAIAFAEGTARVNPSIRGITQVERVKRITFDIGVPQGLMGAVIAANTQEGAPSPLAEMYWSWATGYRHFVMNVQVTNGAETGGGYVHVGSRDCGPAEGKALQDRPACTFVNTPKVQLDVDSLDNTQIAIDIPAILHGVDYRAPIYDPKTFEVIGEGIGIECHSSPMQPDCATVFRQFGINTATGQSLAHLNPIFTPMPAPQVPQ